ncbi:MAG: aldehyde dehydrogenase family protein [Bacteroidia bacterium]|nr:aldehyde dehydrogenase family protein [Bacteroidia bacterium]
MPRLNILKTYKIYIGGQFPRTESGRFYEVFSPSNKLIANVCLSSRKDFRNSVAAASNAWLSWSGKTAYNRGQILYRIAEMLESRSPQFIEELQTLGFSKTQAIKEVEQSVDKLVYYAGWADKYQQIFSSINPVASPFFNFSVLEPTGVISVIAPEESPLLGLVSLISSIIVGGNTCIVLASEKLPLSAVSFAEVLHSSDVPGGVVNILTGKTKELLSHMCSHLEVKGICYARKSYSEIKELEELATLNVKRVVLFNQITDWSSETTNSPYTIKDFQETKTTWHPIENIGTSGNKY